MTRALGKARADGLPAETAGRYVGTLFDDHGGRVYGLCRLLLRDPVDAEDATQQTFLSAYRSLLSGHAPRDPPTWLSTIARNECRARLRARAAERLSPIVDADGAGDDLELIASRQEEIDVLRDALKELPESQREAIVLREFYGLSYREVGAASGLSTSAVKSMLFRARTSLKTRLRRSRGVPGVALLPFALRDSLAQTVPGFASAEVGASSLAKVASVPLAAKLAGATMSIAVVGALGGAAVEAPRVDHPSPPPKPTPKASPPVAPAAGDVALIAETDARPVARTGSKADRSERSEAHREAGEAAKEPEAAEGESGESETPEVEAAEVEPADSDEGAEKDAREHEEASEGE